MTKVTEVLDRVSREVSIDTPASWVTATDTEYKEIRDDFLLETVDDILQRVDLPSPIGKQTTISGTGSESYSLPSDFKRLQRDPMSVYETTSTRRACVPVTDDGEWTFLGEIGTTGGTRFYRLQGYEGNWTISFYRNPGTGDSITVSYVSDLWMADSGGTVGSSFTDPDDVILLPRRVIEAGIVMRWRDRRGLDASGKRAEFEAELSRLSNDRRGRRIVSMGGQREATWNPYDIPVPDYIPDN